MKTVAHRTRRPIVAPLAAAIALLTCAMAAWSEPKAPSDASPGDEIAYRGSVYKTFRNLDHMLEWVVPKNAWDQFRRIPAKGYISFLPREEDGWVMRTHSGYQGVRWNWTFARLPPEERVRCNHIRTGAVINVYKQVGGQYKPVYSMPVVEGMNEDTAAIAVR